MVLEMKYFVLKPHGNDPYAAASRAAMGAYAKVIEPTDQALAGDLWEWARQSLAEVRFVAPPEKKRGDGRMENHEFLWDWAKRWTRVLSGGLSISPTAEDVLQMTQVASRLQWLERALPVHRSVGDEAENELLQTQGKLERSQKTIADYADTVARMAKELGELRDEKYRRLREETLGREALDAVERHNAGCIETRKREPETEENLTLEELKSAHVQEAIKAGEEQDERIRELRFTVKALFDRIDRTDPTNREVVKQARHVLGEPEPETEEKK